MADKIIYTDKEELIDDESIPQKNKVTAHDMNEIKEVVNSHADDIETLETEKADKTEIPTDLSELSNENTKFVNETQLATAVNEEKTQRQNADSVIVNTIATISVDYGRTIELSLDNSTFILTAILKNKNGTELSSSNIDLPIESMIVNGRYDSASKKIILTLQNGNIIEIPVGDLISGLQSEITPQNKLSSDLVDDTNHTNKFVTQAEKNQIETNKNNIADLDENKENISNKVTELTEESTDIQYPSAKAVYDNESALKEKLDRYKNTIETELGDSTDTGTDLTLNGTAEFDVDLEFSGNTYQETTTGKNKLGYNPSTGGYNGVTYKINDDGTITLNGTCTADNTILLNLNTLGNLDLTSLQAGSTLSIFYVSGSISGGTTQYRIYNSNYSANLIVDFSNLSSNNPLIFASRTSAMTPNSNNCNFRVNNNCTFDNLTIKIMLTETEDTEYERYTNGVSPNPEYPQDIQVVKGNNEVKIENKNILDYENLIIKSGYAKDDDGNEFSTGSGNYTTSYTKVKPNTTYTFSADLTSAVYRLYFYDINKNWISRTASIPKATKEYTFTTPNNCYYLQFQNVKTYAINDEAQLELGSATYFVPHKEQTYPITLPEDMFLAKTQNYADKFEGSIDNWYIPNKILKIDSYNGETIETEYISTTGGLDIGATVYYVGTETLPITDTTLITQLNNIKQAYTYQGQTNISQTNADLPFIITADFKLSNLSRIEALESAMETVSSRVDLLEE